MANVDQRIVEMKFDNHNFEANANKSISTLERLKQALNFNGAEKSFNNIEKSVGKMDFSSLSNSIDQINNRFSAMGVAGMTVISNLTTAAMNFGKQVATSIIEPIKTGGWNRASNIAAAKFQIEGLGRTWDEVKDDIDYGVKDTAYGLDAAAKVASQLLASGVEVGDQMKADLRAVSGVAAMTNSTYEDIGSIFTAIAGNGRLMTYQLNQFAFRGLNVAAELAKQWNKTEAEIRDMVTKGEISFNEFAEAMDNAYGEHAKDANKTFIGSLANMKAALSRIGAEFATPYQDAMIGVYNATRNVIDIFKKEKLPPIFEDFKDFTEKASGFTIHVLENLDLSWVDNLVNKLHLAYQAFDTFMTAINPFWKKVEADAEETKENVESTAKDIDGIVQGVLRGEYGAGEDRKKALEDLGYYYEQVQNKVNEILGDPFRYDLEEDKTMENLADSTSHLSSHATDAARNLHELRMQEMDLKATASELKETFASTFDDTWLLSKMDKFRNIGNGIKAAFTIAGNVIDSVVKGASGPLARIAVTLADAFIDAGDGIGKWLIGVGNYLQESGFFVKVQETVNTVFSKFADIVDGIDDYARKGIDYLGQGFQKLKPYVDTVKDSLVDFFETFKETKGYKRLETFVQNAKKKFGELKDSAKNAFETWLGKDIELPKIDSKGWAQKASDAIEWVLDKLDSLKTSVVDFATKNFDTEGSIFKPVIDFFSDLTWDNAGEKITEVFNNVKEAIATFISSITGKEFSFEDVGKSITEFFTNLKESISNWDPKEFFDSLGDGLDSLRGFLLKFLVLLTQLNAIRGLNGFFNIFSNASVLLKDLSNAVKSMSGYVDFSSKILNIAKAVALLAGSMALLSQIDSGDLLKAGAAIAFIAAVLGILYAVVNRYGRSISSGNPMVDMINNITRSLKSMFKGFLEKAGLAAMLIGFALAMKTLADVFLGLLDVPWGKAKNSLKIMAGLFAELAIAMAATTWLSKNNTSISNAIFMMALAESIKILADVAKTLGELQPGKLQQGMLAIGEIAAGIAGIELASGISKSGTGKLVAMMLLIAEIAAAMTMLSILPTEKVDKITNTVTSILNALSLLTFTSGKMLKGKGIGQSIANFAGLILLISAIAGVIYALQGIEVGQVQGIATAVSGIVKALSLLVFVSSKFSGLSLGSVGSLLLFIGGFALVVTALAAVFGALEGFTDSGFSSTLQKSVSVFAALGEAIAAIFDPLTKLAGKLVDSSIVEPLTKLGGNFLEGIKSFFDGVKELSTAGEVDSSGLDSIIAFTLKLTAANFTSALAALTGWLFGSDSLDSLGDELVSFAKSFRRYSKEITKGGGIDAEAVESSANLGMMLTALADTVPNTGGLLGMIVGNNDVDEWGEKLPKLAEGLTGFAEKLPEGGFDTTAVESSISVGKMISALSQELPNSGGLLGMIVGNNDVDEWGEKLPKLAEGLAGYAEKLPENGFDSKAIESSTAIGKMIVGLAQDIPNSGGLLGMLVGNNDVDEWGEKLPKLAEGLAGYAEKLPANGFDENVVKSSETLAQMLVALANSIPDSGGKLADWFGDNTLDNFGTQLGGFADGLVEFTNKVTGQDFTAGYEVADHFKGLLESFYKLSEMDSFIGETSFTNLTTMGEQISSVLMNLEWLTDGTEINTEGLSQMAEGLQSLFDSLQNIDSIMAGFTVSDEGGGIGQQILDSIINPITENTESITSSLVDPIQTAMDQISSIISSSGSTIIDSVTTIVNGCISAIQSGGSGVIGAVTAICNAASSAAAGYYSVFYSHGQNMMAGLAAGIAAGTAQAVAAAQAAAQAVAAAVASVSQIKSPSRVFYRFGRYDMEGLANGITDNTILPVKAITKSAGIVINTMQKSMSNVTDKTGSVVQNIMGSVRGAYEYINSVLAEGIDTTPRITPVVDLSNIQNGVNSLNGMFGSAGYDFSRSLSYATGMYPGNYLKGIETDSSSHMLDVISGIRGDIAYLGQTISSMQMVMDSGELVGSISGGVDRSLGGIQKYKDRWA